MAEQSEKHSHAGQPTKYKVEYATEEFLEQYIKHCEAKKELISLCGLACYIKVTEQSFDNWVKAHPKFFATLARIKQLSKQSLTNKGLVGDYNSTMAKMMLSVNHGMHETQRQEGETVQRIVMGRKKSCNK